MKLNWPKCEWCGTIYKVRKCLQCGRLTCNDCVKYPNEDECIHKKYEPLMVVSWEDADKNAEG